MEEKEKSKMDAFIPKVRECAYYTEKTRRDYLQQCSDYYDEYLMHYLMKEKRFWMMNEEMKVELEMRDHQGSEEHVKNEKEEQQEEMMKKKRKKRGRPRIYPKKQLMSITMEDLRSKASNPFGAERVKKSKKEMKKKKKSMEDAGRPRGRPRIHPKKQLMSITMEDLRSKASDPFGAERVKKSKKEKKSMEDAAAVALDLGAT